MNAEDKIRGALFVLDGGDRLLDLPIVFGLMGIVVAICFYLKMR